MARGHRYDWGRPGRRAALSALVASLLVGVGVSVSVPAAGVANGSPGPAGAWEQVFGDEFSGEKLDRTKWEPNRYGVDYGGDAPFNPEDEDAWFDSDNARVTNGKLKLIIESDPKRIHGKTYPYSSAVVQSAQHFLMEAPSYIEARIAVHECDGCWPAFWTAAPDRWPPELDIFEYFNTIDPSQSRPFFNYHSADGEQSGPTAYGKRAKDFRNRFHVYGMLWDGEQAVPYLNGREYPGATENMTRRDLMIILNLSVQAGHTPSTGAQMKVDWLRVWKPSAAENQ